MRWRFAVVAVLALAAGCLGTGDEGEAVEEAQAPNATPELEPAALQEGQAHVNVTVPVITVGFTDAQAAQLEEDLADETVNHTTSTFPQVLPPDPDADPEDRLGGTFDLGIVPTAHYEVHTLPDDVRAELDEQLDLWTSTGTAAPGHALEALLADELDGTALALDPNAPSLVLVNSDGLDHRVDEWRYQLPNGYYEPTDSFGEREPVHIMDVSHQGLDANDTDGIQEAVHDVTHYRLLQGTVYPPSTAECHALTLVTAYRPTSLANYDPSMQNPEELFNPKRVEAAYQNLTSLVDVPVHVDAKVLELPVDDPALDALSRGEFATFEAQRAWITENWDDYWVEHEGCEAYVSFLVHTDAASTPTPVLGIGLYNHDVDRRIGLSWINEPMRYLMDGDSPLTPASPLRQGESIDEYNYLDYLHTHEAGHTFSMRHPHDISTPDGGGSNSAHEEVWSAMSYANSGRVIDFSAIDQANFARNMVGNLLREAVNAGATEADLEPALEHIAAYEWSQADDELQHVLDDVQQSDTEDQQRSVERWDRPHDAWDPLDGVLPAATHGGGHAR